MVGEVGGLIGFLQGHGDRLRGRIRKDLEFKDAILPSCGIFEKVILVWHVELAYGRSTSDKLYSCLVMPC